MKVNNRVLVMREAITKIVPMLTQRSVKVTQQGTQAFVEYHGTTLEVKRVNLPYIPEDASDQLLDATQGFLDHEVGHVLFTEQKFVKKAAKLQVHSLHNMIEDTFVERKMGEKFPGCGSNLTRMHGFFLTEWIDTQLKEKPEHAAAILMVCAIRAWAGQPAFVDYMKDKWSMMEDVVNRLGADFPKMIRGVNSSEAGLKVAIEAKKRLTPKPQPKAPTPPTPPQPAPPEPPKAEEPQPSDDENAKNGAEQSSGESHDDADDKEPQQPNDMPNLTDEEPEQSVSSAPQSEGDDEDDDEDELDDAEGEEDREPEGEPEQEQPAPGDEEDDDEEDTESPLDVNEPDDDLDDEDTSTEQDDEGDNEGGGMSGEEADNDHDVGDEEGAPSGGGDGLPGGEESGDTAESDAGDAGGQDENGAGQQDAGDEEGHGTPEAGEGDQPIERDPNDDRDFFKEFEDADVKEFDEAAAEALSKQAVEAARGADYIVFTRDEDVLEVLDVPDAFGQEEVTRMQSKVDHMIGPLQKDLQRAIAARSAAIWTGGHRRGQLHGASLARVLTGRDDVFRQKQVSRTKDVAVSLLVDASGSMWEHDKIRVATYAAYALSAVLDNIGITNEVLAFSTKELSFPAMSAMHKEASEHGLKYSRGAALDMRILKSYAERMTPLVRRRFALLAGANAMLQENVDGESVQIANHRLQQQRATRKVMMVLSDGMPACDGRRSPVLASHLKEVVRQIEKRGTDVVALGILDPSVKQFYDRALVLNSVAELPGVVMKELHRLLVQ